MIKFGTTDDYSIFRADILDRWLRFERSNHPDARALRDVYQDTFSPRDISWRRLVKEQGQALVGQLLSGVEAW